MGEVGEGAPSGVSEPKPLLKKVEGKEQAAELPFRIVLKDTVDQPGKPDFWLAGEASSRSPVEKLDQKPDTSSDSFLTVPRDTKLTYEAQAQGQGPLASKLKPTRTEGKYLKYTYFDTGLNEPITKYAQVSVGDKSPEGKMRIPGIGEQTQVIVVEALTPQEGKQVEQEHPDRVIPLTDANLELVSDYKPKDRPTLKVPGIRE